MNKFYIPGIIATVLWIVIPWIWILIGSTIAIALVIDSVILSCITLIAEDGKSQYEKGYERATKDMEKSK